MWGRKPTVTLEFVADDVVDFCRETAERTIGQFIQRSELFGVGSAAFDRPPTSGKREEYIRSFQHAVFYVASRNQNTKFSALAAHALSKVEPTSIDSLSSDLSAILNNYSGEPSDMRHILLALFRRLFGDEIEIKEAALPIADFSMCHRYCLFTLKRYRIDPRTSEGRT